MLLDMSNHEAYPSRHSALAYDVSKAEVGALLEAVDGLDTKIGLIFGFASAILTAPAAFLAIDDSSPGVCTVVLLSLGGGFYLTCALLAYFGFRVKMLGIGPKLNELWANAHNSDYDEETLRWWAADTYKRAYEQNRPHWLEKGRWTELAMFALFVQTVLMAAGLIVAIAL